MQCPKTWCPSYVVDFRYGQLPNVENRYKPVDRGIQTKSQCPSYEPLDIILDLWNFDSILFWESHTAPSR